ncbi:MAG: hydrogenase nickel incorporation protein HypB [Gemmatimonadales bacterium]|jgi:hydrogenase nickel incorporation protein HypB|nr:hydrogenase nickel incorporation protein HypB [Candidatus Poribacteria bacterium]MBT3499666.1 hydrogenase nickel incorporation protein HypB [Gemmatimonadales bacterium]MBT7099429.1 hydrogenase nickel incorporation protein HypB [Candidatus Poribacteria bacterium]
MCDTCGCGIVDSYAVDGVPTSSGAPTDSEHSHDGDQDHRHVHIHASLLGKNDRIAERNRGHLMEKGVAAINMVSSPGAGKTALIERTLRDAVDTMKAGVIVGDLATDNDAKRLSATQAPVVQITTGTVCHLDADMVAHAMPRLDLDALDLLIIENVGNLVCPAGYDLGEDARVVLMSVTEGEDKPAKYPTMFRTADVVVITKVDMAEPARFDREAALNCIHRVAPDAAVIELSAVTGEGMEAWHEYLAQRLHRR